MFKIILNKEMNKFSNLKNSIVSNENKYAVYNPHTLFPVVITDNKITIITIDPAIKTCAMRVAEKNLDTGEIITKEQVLLDFRCLENQYSTAGTSYYTNCYEILEKYSKHFLRAHYIVMEHQCKRASYNVIRMSQHIISFIISKIKDKGNRGLVIEIDARLKSSMFNIPRMDKPSLKKTTTVIAMNILRKRGEEDLAKSIEKLTKRDDHGDTICYEYLWWKILNKNKKDLCFIKRPKLKIKK